MTSATANEAAASAPTAVSDIRVRNASSSGSTDGGAFDVPSVSAGRARGPGIAQKTIVEGSEAQRREGGSQSNLIALVLVVSYIGVGILFYAHVEGFSVVDCIYFSIVIVTTVGYGDITPKTTEGRMFTVFYSFYGIATIGIALGRLASWFLERQKEIAKKATQRLLQHVNDAADSPPVSPNHETTSDAAAEKAESLGTPVKPHSKASQSKPTVSVWVEAIFTESNKAIALALVPLLLSIAGGLLVAVMEKWTFANGLYYSIITITTIGFGDLAPTTTGGRVFAIFYLPLSVISVAHSIGTIMEELSKRNVMKTRISMKELIAMDADGDGQVTPIEYLSYMLVKLGKADQEDIDSILAQFKKLDKDGSGVLDKDDLERLDRHLERAH